MAHVGKLYKLAFRRDLGNVSRNYNSWPEAFRYSQNSSSGPVYVDNRDNLIPLINVAKDGQPPMVWTSNPRIYAGRPYTMRWSILDPLFRGSNSVLFDCHFTDDGENILNWSTDERYITGSPNFCSGFGVLTLHDSTWWRVSSTSMGWTMTAMPWSQYNP